MIAHHTKISSRVLVILLRIDQLKFATYGFLLNQLRFDSFGYVEPDCLLHTKLSKISIKLVEIYLQIKHPFVI